VAPFVIVMLLGSPAAAADNDAERESHDRAQIEKLMWQYVRALDTENAEAYAAVFTPDGQFGSGASAVKGREALKKMINDVRKRAAENEAKSGEKRPAMYHVIANSYLEFLDKDHARLEAYWMTVFADGGPKIPARVAAAGREVDELVRLNGQWLIKARDVAPKE
jgi:uncharacterized protein (TIGR02246 family)